MIIDNDYIIDKILLEFTIPKSSIRIIVNRFTYNMTKLISNKRKKNLDIDIKQFRITLLNKTYTHINYMYITKILTRLHIDILYQDIHKEDI